MTRYWQSALWLAMILWPLGAARAQPGPPHIGYVYPAGGQRGTTLQVTVGGQYVTDTRQARFSGQGIQVVVQGDVKRPPMEEAGQLRDRLRLLMSAERDEAKEKEVAEIQQKLYRTYVMESRRTTPAISEQILLQVTIAPDAAPGPRELRLETPRGVSNRLMFQVGTLPEFCEPEPDVPPEPRDARAPVSDPPKPKTLDIALPAVVNGQIIAREPNQPSWVPERFTPGDADRYRFHARKGQRLVVVASARELIPYLPDAVPGWFQATLTLRDDQGKELAYNDDYRYHPDPVLFHEVVEDGQYVVEIKDAIYRGRPDFVYRVAIGELPFVTSIFPLGGPANGETVVELNGWNLPFHQLTMDATQAAEHAARAGRPLPSGNGTLEGRSWISVTQGDLISNSVPFAVDSLPECLEAEPNDAPPTVQQVTLPMIINGRIGRPGDWDVFCWDGRAGERIIAEVQARRLNSPLDSVLELTDSAGKRLACNDDREDRADALTTHHADSLIDLVLPADGRYCLRLGDAQHEGGPDCAYRLRIGPPRPDYALRIVPSSLNARPRQFVPFTVFAVRTDGFAGEIALSLKDPPADFALGGGTLPAGQDQIRVTLLVPDVPPMEQVELVVEGRAVIDGREVVRTALPADEMTQAFAYKHLVPAAEMNLFVWDWSRPKPAASPAADTSGATKAPAAPRRPFPTPIIILGDPPAKIPAGGTVEVRVVMPAAGSSGAVQVELSDPPDGVTVDSVSRFDKGLVIALRGDAEKAKPGLKGNLIATASQQRTVTEKDGRTREYRSVFGTLPAIPFEIVQQPPPGE